MSTSNNSEKLKHCGKVRSLNDNMEKIKDTGVYLPGIQCCAIVYEGKKGRKHPTICFVLTFMYNNPPSTVVMCKVGCVQGQCT